MHCVRALRGGSSARVSGSQFKDFYTNQVRGELEEVVVDTLLDLVDLNRDGKIAYDEFSSMVMAGAN